MLVGAIMPNERELMDDVLYYFSKGKTREEIFRLTGVDSSQIDVWYRNGRNNPTENYKYFRTELDDIINDPIRIRNIMDSILIKLKNGKSREESVIGIYASTDDISNWILKGKKNHDENTIYFSREYFKIINKPNEDTISEINFEKINIQDNAPKLNTKDLSNLNNTYFYDEKLDDYELECFNYNKYEDQEEKLKMNKVLFYLKKYKSIREASKLANVDYYTILNWIENGRYQSTKNTLYFFGEYNKIKNLK